MKQNVCFVLCSDTAVHCKSSVIVVAARSLAERGIVVGQGKLPVCPSVTLRYHGHIG